MIDGKIITSTFESNIFHEVEHAFQMYKSRKLLYNNIYDLSQKYMDSEDNYLHVLACLIYLTIQFEVDANINGLYPYLIDKQYKTPDEVLNCPYVQNEIGTINQFYNEMMSWKNDEGEYAFKIFGHGKKWFIDKYNKAIKRFKEKVGKLFTRQLIIKEIFLTDRKYKPFPKVNGYVL